MTHQASRFPPYAAFFTTLLLIVPTHLLLPLNQVVSFPYSMAGVVPIGLGIALAIGQQGAFARHVQGDEYHRYRSRVHRWL